MANLIAKQQDVKNKPSETKSSGRNLLADKSKDIDSMITEARLQTLATSPLTSMPFAIMKDVGIKESQTAPFVGGTVGAFLGSQVGAPNVGAGVGAGLGDLVSQSLNKLYGNGDDISVSDAVILGGGVGFGGKAFDVALKSAGLSIKLIPESTRAKFFDKALQAVNVGKKAATRNFTKSMNKAMVNKPQARIDLSDEILSVKSQFDQVDETLIPQLKTAVSRSKKLKGVVENPKLAENLTLAEAYELKNSITSTTNTITKKAIKGKTTPNERLVFDLLKRVDRKIDSQFPEMVDIRGAYSQAMDYFDLARPLVEPGTAVESSIFSSPRGIFGTGGTPLMKSVQGKRAAKGIMGMTKSGDKMFKAAQLAHALNRVADTIGRLSGIAVGGAALTKLTGGRNNFSGDQ